MFTIPNFIFGILVNIPFVGNALRRNSDFIEESERGVDVPRSSFIDCLIRLFLVVVIPVSGVLYVVSKRVSTPKVLTNVELADAFELETEEFKNAIRSCKADQLNEVVNQFTDDPSKPYEERVRLIRNRIIAANKISRTRLPSLQIGGIISELDLRSKLSLWNFERKLYDIDEQKDLITLAKLYESVPLYDGDVRGDSLMEHARLASIIALVVGWVEDPKATEAQVIGQLENKVEALRVPFLQDSVQGDLLAKLAKIASSRLSEDQESTRLPTRLQELIAENYHASEAVIRRDFKLLNFEQSASRFALKNDIESNVGFIGTFIDKFNSMIKIKNLSDADFRFLLEKLQAVAESGWADDAKYNLEVLNSLMKNSSEASEETVAFANKLQKRLSWIGTHFPYKSFRTISDNPAVFPDNGAAVNIVLLINNENKQQSNGRLQQMIRTVNNSIGKIPLNLAVVFVHDDDKLNGMPQMREFEKQTKKSNVRIWQANINSEFWKEKFGAGIELKDIPFVFVMNNYDNIYSVNPNRIETNNALELINSNK